MNNLAKWIWKDDDYQINDYGWFFKQIDVVGINIEGSIKVSAHNYMKVFVNDHMISGMVTPASSVAHFQKLYLEYDITKYLKQGVNTISVLVLFLGGSGQNYVNVFPGMILSGKIKTSRQETIIYTDESWYYYDEIPYLSHQPYRENRRITPVEFYDSRIKINPLKSKLVSVSLLENLNPKLVKQLIPEGEIHEEIKPRFIKRIGDTHIFDTGRIVSGFVRFNLKACLDQLITIRYSEDLIDGLVGHNVANETSEYYLDYYLMNGDARNLHQADFTYKAFRYFQIENYPHNVNEEDLTVVFASTNVTAKGLLKSNSYPLINQLYECAINTHLNNIQGMLVDCPHREQAQYLGDSDLQLENLIYNFSHCEEITEKVLTDFMDAQLFNGKFPFVAPTNNDHDEFGLRISEYDLYYITILEKLYSINNDLKKVKKYFPTAQKTIELYLSQIDETGLIVKDDDWHISDWPYPTVNQDGKYLTTQNLLMVKVLKIMDRLSKLINQSTINYQKYYIKLIESIRIHLMKDGLLVDSYQVSNYHQGVNALGVDCGIFTTEEIPYVLEFIKSRKFGSSVILGRSVLKVAFEYQMTEFAFQYMFDYEKGWGNILRQGWQTMWEGFDDIESHSHAWNAYPLRMIQTYLVGIQINPDDCQKVVIKPQFVERVKDIEAHVVTKKGTLKFGYSINDKQIKFNYFIPKYIHACLEYLGKIYNLETNQESSIIVNSEEYNG